MESKPSSINRTRNYALVAFLFFTSSIYLAVKASYTALVLGGNEFSHGDWLIINEGGFVRRGAFGDLWLALSDFFAWDVIFALTIFQLFCLFSFCVVSFLGLHRCGLNDRLTLLVLSPAFVLIFVTNDFWGGFRKELLIYLVFVPLISVRLLGARYANSLIYSPILIFALSVFSHEANLLSAPFFVCAIALNLYASKRVDLLLPIILLIASMCGFASAYVLFFQSINADLVCQSLTFRGLDNSICNGAINWLDKSASDAIATRKAFIRDINFYELAGVVAFSTIPFMVACARASKPIKCLLVFLVSTVMFLPLYFIAADWGRWISFQATLLTACILIASLNFKLSWLEQPLPQGYFYVLLIPTFCFGIQHVGAAFGRGLIVTFVDALYFF